MGTLKRRLYYRTVLFNSYGNDFGRRPVSIRVAFPRVSFNRRAMSATQLSRVSNYVRIYTILFPTYHGSEITRGPNMNFFLFLKKRITSIQVIN